MMRYKRKHRLDKGMRGWIYRTAKKNFWRVAAWYDLEDLIQDGYVCYCRCQQMYPHIKSDAHFMALVKVTYTNYIHVLSTKATHTLDACLPDFDRTRFADVDQALEAMQEPQPEEATLAALIRGLPSELQLLLRVLIEDARDIPIRTFKDGTRETTNQYLCRLVGADPTNTNMEQRFRIALGQEDMLDRLMKTWNASHPRGESHA